MNWFIGGCYIASMFLVGVCCYSSGYDQGQQDYEDDMSDEDGEHDTPVLTEPHMPPRTPGGLQHRYPTYLDMRRRFVLSHLATGQLSPSKGRYFIGDRTISIDEYTAALAEKGKIDALY